ncbi:MAG: hypothetical protein N2322_05110 [Terrimicrobiaceae bacterium]|nr:hypothetical protein [Terrimicrobiaceae bacterium]
MLGKVLNFLRGGGGGGGGADSGRIRPSLTPHIATMAIVNAIRGGRPFLACRLGWFEAYATGHFDRFGELTQGLRAKMWNTPGIFPPTDEEFRKFHAEFTAAAAQADIIGLMHSPFEAEVLRRWCPRAFTCELQDLEPYYNPLPWSSALEGLRVLVVHPFAETISRQFAERREKLFEDARVLPRFELLTLKPPQTLCGNTAGFSSWSEALGRTRDQIAGLGFDAAIVGCGAYGLPLGAFIKSLGRPCVHMGGAVQTLFGVIGARWLEKNPVLLYVNSHWRRPAEHERPPNWEQAEGGCYW